MQAANCCLAVFKDSSRGRDPHLELARAEIHGWEISDLKGGGATDGVLLNGCALPNQFPPRRLYLFSYITAAVALVERDFL